MKKIILFSSLFLNTIFMGVNAQNAVSSSNDVFAKFSNGEIICSDNGKSFGGNYSKNQSAYDAFILGVFQRPTSDNAVASAMFAKLPIQNDGVCLVKYNSEGGAIKKGDILTSSS